MKHKGKRYKHCNIRLIERFGFKLSYDELDRISLNISNYSELKEYSPICIDYNNGASFHLINVRNNNVVFLYDWSRGHVMTVYRESWFSISDNGELVPNSTKQLKRVIRNKNRVATFRKKYMAKS